MSELFDGGRPDVAGAPNRPDQWFAAIFYFLSQAADLDVDGPVDCVGLAPAGPVHQLIARQNAVRTRDEAGEQVELGPGE